MQRLLLQPKVIVLFVFCWLSSISKLSAQTHSFDKVKWEQDINYRSKVAKSAELRKLVIGKSKEEVIALLGEPEKKDLQSFVYCLDKKTLQIANCDDKKEDCYACNAAALAIVFVANTALDIIAP